MITHKRQRSTFYLLLLVAFTCSINVSLQASENPKSEDPKKDEETWVEKEIKKMMDEENDK